jgi:hypothetical protein
MPPQKRKITLHICQYHAIHCDNKNVKPSLLLRSEGVIVSVIYLLGSLHLLGPISAFP